VKCIIIDDEPLAIDVLKTYCEKLPFLNLRGCYTSALDAIVAIKEQKIDLIFSDIEMPQINGIEFINSLDNKPLFIFTTAYSQYAIEGFELNAIDYLVKPIPYQRFIKAVTRAKELMSLREQKVVERVFPSTGEPTHSHNFLFVKSEYETIRIGTENIKYIQGLKDYLKIHVEGTNKPVLTIMSFRDILEKLPKGQFIRVHKSFVVNVSYIKAIQRNRVLIDDIRIPVGEFYKNDFFTRLGL